MDVKGAQRIAQSGATSEPSVTWILGGGRSPHPNQVSEIYKMYKFIKSDVLGFFFFFRNVVAPLPKQECNVGRSPVALLRGVKLRASRGFIDQF